METDKILNTKRAHQLYSNPLVGVIVFLINEKNEVAIFKEKSESWKLPERFARGNEYLKESVRRIISHYLRANVPEGTESCVLLSGQDFRQDAYQFNFVAFIPTKCSETKFKKNPKWVGPKNLSTLNIYSNHAELLKKFFSEGSLRDDLVVPSDPSKRSEPDTKRLAKTKRIHALYFPMPLITADALLLKFSKNGEFEGIILEKRAMTLDREPGKWALPAGFAKAHERISETLAYEVFEETKIRLKKDNLLSSYKIETGPHRDPKWFVWTQLIVAYTTENLPKISEIKRDTIASQEIERVKAFLPDKLPPENQIAFDQSRILSDFSSSIEHYIKAAQERIYLA